MTKGLSIDLDFQRYYPINLKYNQESKSLTIRIDSVKGASARFRHNFRKLLAVTTESNSSAPPIAKAAGDSHEEITFNNVPENFTLQLGDRLLGTFENTESGLKSTAHVPLTVSQKRMIGTYHLKKINDFNIGPKPETGMAHQTTLNHYKKQIEEAKEHVTGDFHTHSSGAISAKGLTELAKKHDAYYPIHLLEEIGIPITDERKEEVGTKWVKRIPFSPLEPQEEVLGELINENGEVECFPVIELEPRELEKLRSVMVLPDSKIATFYEMEVPAYQTRYPFTKNPKILRDSIKQAAKEAFDQGLNFIELSYTSLENPAIFKAVHETIHEIEQDPDLNIDVRVKYGIPRTNSQPAFKKLMEKAKVISESPYVSGIDILGYEDNRTDSFEGELNRFAKWAKNHDPELMLSIHAGENNKNKGNVHEALQFAKNHNITVRIGHGVHGLHNPETLALATALANEQQPPRVYIETNPDSNIALNNIMDPADLKWQNFIEHNIPFVPGSDSYGHYQTSRQELAATFVDAGMAPEALKAMGEHQQALKKRVLDRSKEKAAKIDNWDGANGLAAFIEKTTTDLDEMGSVKRMKDSTPDRETIAEYLKSQDVELLESNQLSNPATVPEAFKCKPNGNGKQENKKPIVLLGASGSSWNAIEEGHQHKIAVAYDMLVHALDPEKVYFAQGRNKDTGISKVINEAIERANKETDKNGNTKPPFVNLGFQADIQINNNSLGEFAHLDYMLPIKNRTHIAEEITNFAVEHKGVIVCAGGAAYTNDSILKADLRMKQKDAGTLFVMAGPEGASNEKARGLNDSYTFESSVELLQKMYQHHATSFNPEVGEMLKTNDMEGLEKLYKAACDRIGDEYGTPDTFDQVVTTAQTVNKEHERGGRQ